MKLTTSVLLILVGFGLGMALRWSQVPNGSDAAWTHIPQLTLPTNLRTSEQMSSAFTHVFNAVGWKHGTQFASYRSHAVGAVLQSPSLQVGAFLIIVPGKMPVDTDVFRRKAGEPFLSLHPSSNTILNKTLPLKTLDTLSTAIETMRGRNLPAFTLELTPLPLCSGGSGCCAVWEGSTGRIILDTTLASKMASTASLPSLLREFTTALTEQLTTKYSSAPLENNPSAENQNNVAAYSNTSRIRNIDPHSRQLGEEGIQEGDEQVTLSSSQLAEKFTHAGIAALTLTLVTVISHLPLWWCLACPIVLGMLAPFIWNFGLTAAAEQLCSALQLPDDTCSDLWWGAFALALVMSLGSAVPIVWYCKLEDCGRRHRLF